MILQSAKLFCVVLCVLAMTVRVCPAFADAAPLAASLQSSYRTLRGYVAPNAAKRRVLDYATKSTDPRVREGLALLLEKESSLAMELRRSEERIGALQIDGRKGDWSSALVTLDARGDTAAIDGTASRGAESASDDLRGAGFVMDDNYAYAMIEPVRMPAHGQRYQYHVLLYGSGGEIISLIVWTESFNAIYTRNPRTGAYAARYSPRGAKFARGEVFEAKVPRAFLGRLPYVFGVQAVSWQWRKNLYDAVSPEPFYQPVSELYRRSALELLTRYAEVRALEPNDPFPVVQALSDAYLYKRANASTKRLVIRDGLAMMEQGRLASQYRFRGQEPLNALNLPQLLVWADRSLMYGGYGSIHYYPAKYDRFNAESYHFMFLRPETLAQCRSLLEQQGLLTLSDLSQTVTALNHRLWEKIKYRRASFDAIQQMYDANPDDPWTKQVYEESRSELERGDVNVGSINGAPINKGLIFAPSFQILYLLAHDTFFGNCVDVAAMESACLKAVGVPAVHVYYGPIWYNHYEEYHSLEFYYSSAEKRWLNFERGDTVGAAAVTPPLVETGKYYFKIDRPPVGSYWQTDTPSIMGSPMWNTNRNYIFLAGKAQWDDLVENGLAAARLEPIITRPDSNAEHRW